MGRRAAGGAVSGGLANSPIGHTCYRLFLRDTNRKEVTLQPEVAAVGNGVLAKAFSELVCDACKLR